MANTFSKTEIGVGAKPYSVTMADVDDDGDLDMLAANQDGNTVSVRLNDGSGRFTGNTEFSAGIGPSFVTTADVDRDGDLDMLVANRDSATVTVRLNNGSGFFAGGTDIPVGLAALSVAMADVDRDGDLDLLALSQGDSVVSVRLNDGRGTFSGSANYIVGADPYSLTVADVDRDGDLDMLFVNYNDDQVSVLLNSHNGTFTRGKSISVGRGPASVAMADVDRDGDLDLLAGDQNADTVSVRLNDGRGSFSGTTKVAVGSTPRSVTMSDMDGDGDLDMLTANLFGGTVSLRLNDGRGTFSGGTNFAVGENPVSLTTADVDRDGDLDIVVANLGSDTVSILRNDRAGAAATSLAASGTGAFKIGDRVTFTLTTDAPVPVGGTPKLMLSNGASASYAGLDASGRLTFAYTVAEGDAATRGLAVTGLDTTGGTLGGGAPQLSFGTATAVSAGLDPGFVAMADMDRDGDLDMLVANRGMGTVSVRLNDGRGNFYDGGEVGVGGRPMSVIAADVNEDGHLDILAANQTSGTVSVRLNNGNGTYSVFQDVGVSSGPVSLATADVNGDGRLDLITANIDANTVSVRFGTGLGSFGGTATYGTSVRPSSVTAADLDGDGDIDLLAGSQAGRNVNVLLNDGSGAFRTDGINVIVSYRVGGSPSSVTAADLDRDGDVDFLTANELSNTVSVRLNDGRGVFSGGSEVGVGGIGYPAGVSATADLDGDGDLDLLAANFFSNTVSVRLNDGRGAFSGGRDIAVSARPLSIATADVNGDGRPDIVVSHGAVNGASGSVSVLLNTSVAGLAFDAASLSTAPGAATGRALDATRPAAPKLALASDTGASASDHVTSNAALTMTGVERDAKLSYTIDGGPASTRYDPAALADGRHTVTVTQTDVAGNVSPAGSLTFTLTNGAPVISSGNGGTTASLAIAENRTAVALLKASDADGDTLSWSIAGGADAALFAIDARTGALAFRAAPDFETPKDVGRNNIHDVTVRVTDGKATDTQALSVAITDIKGKALTGSAGSDTLAGTPEADTLDGKGGADTMNGGAGNDVYYVDHAGDRVREVADGGTDRILTSVDYALSAGQAVEVLEVRNRSSTTTVALTGNAFANTLVGNIGANILDGGAGADLLAGSAGDDLYYVDHAGDRVKEAVGGGTDRILTSVDHTLEAGQEVEVLEVRNRSSTTAIDLTGNEFANTLVGNIGANILDGGAGADLLAGSAGNDLYYVDHAGDRVKEAVGGGNDRILTSVDHTLGSGQEVEVLEVRNRSSITAIDLTGNEFANTLRGNGGINILDGKAGSDTLQGGAGNDTFAFSTALGSGNVDHIADFSVVNDTIQLARGVFSALSAGGLASSAFKDLGNAGAVVDANDRILYNHDTGALAYDADGSGTAKAAIPFAVIDTKVLLTQADFLVA